MTSKVSLREKPSRALALATETHVLFLRPSGASSGDPGGFNSSTTSLSNIGGGHGQKPNAGGHRCIVELIEKEKADLKDFRTLSHSVYGTLGLITVDNDVFLCVVSGATTVATIRPGETVQRILSVDFHCLTSAEHDHILNDDTVLYLDDNDDEPSRNRGRQEGSADEHPCLALKKLLSGGSFYYSSNFNLTSRLQERTGITAGADFDAFDKNYLWNSYMIKPLLDFRGRLSNQERKVLDATRLLTSAIRGFVLTMPVPASASPARTSRSGPPSALTLISRLSCRRAGTRFNARGVDDDGNVANFVETELVFWSPTGVCFSYVQIRGSIPVFWEQAAGILPGQQKIQLTRSPQATQPAFDKHFEELEIKYGSVHIVNLLSKEIAKEIELSSRYQQHVQDCSLNSRQSEEGGAEHRFLRETDYDFHAETRGGGYEAASSIRRYISESAEGFGYCLFESSEDQSKFARGEEDAFYGRTAMILQQQGVFRTNCLDCLDRTNLVQSVISQMAMEAFIAQRHEQASSYFVAQHGSLWADNGDALSRIYAGTGALKSSFTRHGKMSLAGALADARKSATRMYINNFADKGRQTIMDTLLGRLIGQTPVYLFDPINDHVTSELNKRASEYSSQKDIIIWAGTFNLNGRTDGLHEDLSSWLCAPLSSSSSTDRSGSAPASPHIVAVGFQEIVELNPQHIMSTEPTRRQEWEEAVKRTLNANARNTGSEEYVGVRGSQLVGASLSIFAKAKLLPHIKNVEASLKKTGMSGMAGNKGAVAIRMDLDSTSLCFITAHLAAGFANYEERNRDYKTISHGLRFQRNRNIENHDTVIWMGDFNYRIGLADESVRRLAKEADFGKLYENDQLNLQMVAGLTFPFYSEARILFKPTYRYDIGTDDYDTSEKRRIPAWCDRILRKGNNLRQLSYNTAPLYFSDHRPVYATFSCTINAVNETHKDALARDIYEARRNNLGQITSTSTPGDDLSADEEDLLGYESIEPGLPPASSDKRKWWLDTGLPSRSKMMPPNDRLVPNPERASNPFTQSDIPEWSMRPAVTGDGTPSVLSSAATSRRPSGQSVVDVGVQQNSLPRKLPPRFDAGVVGGTDGANDNSRSMSSASMVSARSQLSQAGTAAVTRKPAPAPPVPAKKPGLSSRPGSGAQSPTSNAGSRGVNVASSQIPPARRPVAQNVAQNSASTQRSAARDLLGDDHDIRIAPRLPPRRGTAGLMDDGDDDGGGALSGWAPLKPT